MTTTPKQDETATTNGTTADRRVAGKHRSWETTEGVIRAPNRAMMWAMGLTDKDINAPFVGVASTHNEVTPCNSGIAPLVEEVKRGVFAARGTPFTFGTITVSDAISMGTEGMKGSLVSREVIADSIETVCFAERFDGVVAVAGCDKSLPGAMMAMARLNLPSVFIYGGSILPGNWRGRDIQIQTVFEAVGQRQAGLIDDDELRAIEVHACPGPGACGGMFTANTMSSIGEALGLSLPGSASEPAVDQRKLASSRRAGEAVLDLLRQDIRPSDILTREAFENAVALVVSMGGSTNSALHLPAIAHEVGVELTLKDIHDISMRTPLLADMKPGGRYLMFDLDRVGGVPVVMKRLLEAGLLHGGLPDRDRQDGGGEPTRLAGLWRHERRQDGRGTAQQDRRTRCPVRQPGAAGVHFEGRRTPVRGAMVRQGQGFQPGRAGHGRAAAAGYRGRRRCGDPL